MYIVKKIYKVMMIHIIRFNMSGLTKAIEPFTYARPAFSWLCKTS